MHAKEIQAELARLNHITRPSRVAVGLDINEYAYGKPLKLRIYGAVAEDAGFPLLVSQTYDDFTEALAAAGRAVSLLESCRIIGNANPGEGDFIKHLGRA